MEVTIILILLIIHLLGIIVFKPKTNILSCGIFGWAGKNYKTFNKAKFDIQGLYNDSRGGDSCGITVDGDIYYGVNGSKHYSTFLHKQNYEIPVNIPVVIGHTRKSSSGVVNSENAHPFGFGDNNEMFEFIGVHNGTLSNQESIAKEYNLETTVKEKNNFGIHTFKRNKIDSEILLEIIYTQKNFKVLSDYVGGAALLFTNTLEPNVLYAFKGASRIDSYDKGNDFEERPLFYYQEAKNSLYISSLQESLEAIGGVANKNLFSFRPNVVYKITDGNILTAEKTEISRKTSHQRPFVYKNTNYAGYNQSSKKYDLDCEWEDLREYGKKEEKRKIKIQEEENLRIFKSPITFNKLRYNRNGHLINGIFTWVPEYGFYPVCQDITKAKEDSLKFIDKNFDSEYGYFIDYANDLDDEYTLAPFTTENGKIPCLFYFYEGIMLETDLDYVAVTEKVKNYNIWDLSEMSKHPVIEINKKISYSNSYLSILKSRNSFTGTVCPLGSSKIYYIEKGELVDTKKVEVNDSKCSSNLLLNAINKKESEIQDNFMKLIKDNELEVTTEELTEDEKIEIDKEEIETIKVCVESLMSPIYLQIQESIVSFEEFKNQKFVEEIMEISEEYLMSLDEIIEKTYK